MARTVVGLDIGSSAVRAVELTGGGRPSLRHSGEAELPSGVVEAGTVRNPAVVTQAIRSLWRDASIKNRSVRLGIGSGSVLVRQLELDWMPPADLRKALRFQVADLLPVSVDDANLDHVLLGEVEREDPESGTTRRFVKILLVATARGAVDEMVRCVRSAGLRPTSADLAALGLIRAAARSATLAKEQAQQTEAIIDIGADKVAVAVHTGGRPHIVRVVAGVGGSTLTRALVDQTGRTWEEAEALKRACALPLPSPALAASGDGQVELSVLSSTTGPGSSSENDPVAAHILLGAARQVVAELRSTLDFHASTDPEHTPTRVLITGGGAALGGMEELCRRTLDLPVRRFEPRDVLPGLARTRGRGEPDGNPLASDPSMVVPIGLAVGEAS